MKSPCLRVLTVAIGLVGLMMRQPADAYTILAPDSIVAGQSIADWTAAWWTWALQAPNDTNPLNDPDGRFASVQNNGPVFFIAGNTATRSFTVPGDKPILFPLLNAFDVEPVPPDPAVSLSEREAVVNTYISSWINAVDKSSLFASIDGTLVANPSQYFEETGFFDMGPTEAGSYINAIGVPTGFELFPTKAAGYWLMVDNLSPGLHTLHFGGSFNEFNIPENCCTNGPFGPFSTNTTDTIFVVSEPSSTLLLLCGLVALFWCRPRPTAAD